MKNINRIICIIIITVLIIPFSGLSASAKSGEITLDDNIIQVVFSKGLGIISDYDAEAEITAGDVANAVNRLSDSDSMADGFYASYEYDKKVKISEIIKIFVNLAGYEKYAALKYGAASDGGTVMMASELGLLKGIPSDKEKNATMRDLAYLSYNLLETKVLKTRYNADGTSSFEVSDTKYLNRVLSAYALEGIVEAVSNTSLEPGKETRSNSLIISGSEYFCEKCEYEEYIGRSVKALIKEENGMLYVKAMFDKSEVLGIDAEDIIENSTDKFRITYYNANDKKVGANISKRADVIYNYSVMPDYSADDLKISQGRIVLIDNDYDGTYDVVKIEEYKTMWLFSSSVDSEKIVDNYGRSESIKELIENEYPIYDAKGNVVIPDNMPYDMVATYYLNKGGEVVCIYFTNEKGGGRISEFKTEENKIKIDGKEIGYSAQLKSEIESLDAGTSIIYYLDRYGKIAYYELAQEPYLYGYLVSFSEGKGLSNPKVKIFTEDNDFKVFDTADTIVFNGKKISVNEAFKYSLDGGLWDEVGKKNQIVKYKANAKNVLSELLTATDTKIEGSDRPFKEKDSVLTYYSRPRTISADTRLNNLTKVFLVPRDLTFEKRFEYGTFTLLSNDQDYTCQVFDIDENRYAKLVLARIENYEKPSVDQINGSMYIIDDNGEFKNDEGENSIFITAYDKNGELCELFFNNANISATNEGVTKSVSELKRGDVISIGKTEAQEVGDFCLWYANGKTQPYENAKRVWYSETSQTTFISDGNTYTYGRVEKLLKNGFLANNRPLNNGDTPEERSSYNRIITTEGKTPVFICDNNSNKLKTASVSDICEGDNIFMQLSDALPILIVIYR